MMAFIYPDGEDLREGSREPGTGGRDLLPGLSGRETLEEIRGEVLWPVLPKSWW